MSKERHILDATYDFSIYKQRFYPYYDKVFNNNYSLFLNNYKQLVIQIFDQMAIDMNLTLSSPQLNFEYFHTDNTQNFKDEIIQSKSELSIMILHNLNRHGLLTKGVLVNYYLVDTNEIMHILGSSFPIETKKV